MRLPGIIQNSKFKRQNYNLKFKILFTFYFLLALLTFNFLLLTLPTPTSAQGIEVTNVYDVADSDQVVDGDIVISSSDGIRRADKPYDARVFGIVQISPIITYRRVDGTGLPVSRTGVARVNVSSANGPIKVGDYITSSEALGKGQKVGANGYSVGIALENFDGTEGEDIQVGEKQAKAGQIQVALKVEYVEVTGSRSLGRAFDYLNSSFLKNVQDPEQFTQVVRYIAAALAVLIAFAVAFFTFSRSIPKAMEAIGRNPLAASAIRISIILNIGFTIASALVGIIAAVIIIKL